MTFKVPAWLDMPPDKMSVKPPVTSRAQSLPFRELTWRNFERLVLRLVRRQENIRQCSLYGTAGQKQEGLDILSVSTKSAELTCYQCKNVASFSDSDIRTAVGTFLEGKWANDAGTFVLVCRHPPAKHPTSGSDTRTRKQTGASKHSVRHLGWFRRRSPLGGLKAVARASGRLLWPGLGQSLQWR